VGQNIRFRTVNRLFRNLIFGDDLKGWCSTDQIKLLSLSWLFREVDLISNSLANRYKLLFIPVCY
jgi:hypothetical protein